MSQIISTTMLQMIIGGSTTWTTGTLTDYLPNKSFHQINGNRVDKVPSATAGPM